MNRLNAAGPLPMPPFSLPVPEDARRGSRGDNDLLLQRACPLGGEFEEPDLVEDLVTCFSHHAARAACWPCFSGTASSLKLRRRRGGLRTSRHDRDEANRLAH